MEALRGVELTSTNRPCDLTSFTKANIVVGARTPGGISSVSSVLERKLGSRYLDSQN